MTHKKINSHLHIKNFNFAEIGRSMVEMLAVLAVVGVLGTISLKGLQIAMSKYMANLLIKDMNDISQIIALDLIRANIKVLSLPSPYNKGQLLRTDYEVSYGCREGKDSSAPCLGVSSYYVEIKGISYRVCREAVPLIRFLKNTDIMYLNGVKNGSCSKTDDNTFLSVFSLEGLLAGGTGLTHDPIESDKSCQSNEDCGSSSGIKNPCVDGQCVGCTDNSQCWLNMICNKETGICENPANKCNTDEECRTKDSNKPYCSPAGNCTKCYQDDQCNSGQLCRTESSSCFVEKIQSGECFNITPKEFTLNNVSYKYFSSTNASWWDAQRWCRSVGRHMVSFSDLGCEDISSGVCRDKSGNIPDKISKIAAKIGASKSSFVSDRKTACLSYHISFSDGQITSKQRINGGSILCQ